MSDMARSFLNRARKIDSEIDILMKSEKETRDRIMSITQRYDGDGAQSTKDPHKYDHLVELESMIDELIDKLVSVKKETIQVISELPERRVRNVLMDYYIRMLTFEQIAVEQVYSYRQVKRIHAKGLVQVDRYLTGK